MFYGKYKEDEYLSNFFDEDYSGTYIDISINTILSADQNYLNISHIQNNFNKPIRIWHDNGISSRVGLHRSVS